MNFQSVNYYYFLVLAGGTNENYNNDDPSMKKCLRKTRGELLLQEYEVGFGWRYIAHSPAQTCNLCLYRFVNGYTVGKGSQRAMFYT